MKLWGGRFSGKLDPAAWDLNASLGVDRRLAEQDVRGSRAWAEALTQAGVLTAAENEAIQHGLERIAAEFGEGSFAFQESDEDIHTAVERRLGELIGSIAGKLHTGRSRNDQVATDLRLWLLDHLTALEAALIGLQAALLRRAEADPEAVLPGYTHLQRAQPILLSHWWLAHFWPLQRDRERLADLAGRTAVLPLGSAALAGTPYPVDRAALATALGFREPSPNSLDAVSDRDFAAEFTFCAALTGVHLSRLAEAVILFSSAEFGFFELSDAYATGSSLMPQKKNPDVFELARGQAGGLLGALVGLLGTLKGLPSAYDKDLQEDKAPLFSAYDTLAVLLPVLAGALDTLLVLPERMIAALDSGLMATDLADLLVELGLPFRQAHAVVGEAVQLAAARGIALDELGVGDYAELDPQLKELLERKGVGDAELRAVFDPRRSVGQRAATGGTAPDAVAEQLALAQRQLQPLLGGIG